MIEVARYAVIRFRPYAETGEFANIGIVAVSSSTGQIVYELAPKRFQRIRGFFDAQTHYAYSVAIDILKLELERLTEYLPQNGGQDARHIFDEIVRRRESSIIFSEPRTILLNETLARHVERLFARFVRRELGPAEIPEVILAQDIRRELRSNGIRYFKGLKIQDDVVPVQFPLAVEDTTIHAIRPLAFSQKTSLSVFDYGAHWRHRLEYLLRQKKIHDGNVLLVVEPPKKESEIGVREAFGLACEELAHLPFEIVSAFRGDMLNPQIVEFAERARPYHLRGRMFH